MYSALRKLNPLQITNKSQECTKYHRPFWKNRPLFAATTLTTAGGLYFTLASTSVSEVQENNSFGATIGAYIRFLRSVKTGLLISVDYSFSMLGLSEDSANFKAMMSRIHQRAADRILNACLTNGGSYIKLGQGLVSLSHIIPKEYVNTLKQLHDKCLSRGEDEVKQLFIEDFGKSYSEMFLSFAEEPIAAASLAQVYKAVTKDNESVAVKVQYIDLQKRFINDMHTIRFLLKAIGFMHKDFDFAWVVNQLSDQLKLELDFFNEGLNSERCARELKHLSYIYVPKVHWDLCSTRVLVTDFVDAIKINDQEKLKANGFNLADIDTKLFNCFGEQIFQTGFVHGDPHPGNILIRKDKKQTQLVLLDHGLYQEIEDKDRIALSHFWKALVIADHASMEKFGNELGVNDYAMFAEIITQRPLKSQDFKLVSRLTDAELKYMTEFAQQRFDKIMETLKSMPNSMIFVTRNLNTIRAIAHDHGDPIDRYTILARAATKTAFKSDGFIARILQTPGKMYFEFKILTNAIWLWFTKSYFHILYMLGRTPDTSGLLANIN